MQLVNDPQQVDEHLSLFVDMHEARRKQLGETGCFAVSGFQTFIEELNGSSDQSPLQLRLLYLEGKPAAVNLGKVIANCLFVYQTGFFPDFAKHQPGWILNLMVIQEGLAGGFQSIDFLRGNERYKRSLGAVPTDLARVEVSAKTSAARLRRSLRVTGATLKEWWGGASDSNAGSLT